MKMQRLAFWISLVALFLGSASIASADLEVRMGGQAVYDTDLDTTWVSDANLALTNQFGLTLSGSEFDETPNTVGSTGLVTWENANAWIAGMNAANHLGFNDWRLPTTSDPDTSCTTDPEGTMPITGGAGGYNCVGSEMGHLIYVELGGTPGSNLVLTSDPAELAKFTNLTSTDPYIGWSGEFALNPATFAWTFEFISGQELASAKVNTVRVWAIRSGDVGGAAAVPVADLPARIALTLVLFALGFVTLSRRSGVRI